MATILWAIYDMNLPYFHWYEILFIGDFYFLVVVVLTVLLRKKSMDKLLPCCPQLEPPEENSWDDWWLENTKRPDLAGRIYDDGTDWDYYCISG